MESNLNNMYLFQALDAYPYNLEATLEALNYALSYDDKNVQALCLMGRVYAEQLKDYETAKLYYAEAIAQDMGMPKTYPYYIETLIWNEDYEEAQKLLDYALTIKGIDKAVLYAKQGLLFERTGQFSKALKAYKTARKTGTYNGFIDFVEGEISRVKKKIKSKKTK